MTRLEMLLVASLCVWFAWASPASAPACALGGCPPWTCVDEPDSCEPCVCNMDEDVCEVPEE